MGIVVLENSQRRSAFRNLTLGFHFQADARHFFAVPVECAGESSDRSQIGRA